MAAAGATRIGASASVKIVEGATARPLEGRRASDARYPQIRGALPRARGTARLPAGGRGGDFGDARPRPAARAASPKSSSRSFHYDLFAILLYSEKRARPRGSVTPSATARKSSTTSSIPLGEGITGAAARGARTRFWSATSAPMPRYLNAMDAVRSELAVPMLARGKLVGVIDLQSTRVDAYSEYDRSLLRLHRLARRRRPSTTRASTAASSGRTARCAP